MLRSIINFFRKPSLMEDAEKTVLEMLDIAYNMLQYSMSIVISKKKEKEDIYETDRKLNRMQIKVRKDVLEHLAINPAQDIIPSLILSCIVIDIERIGDFSKNLIELSHKYPEPLEGPYIKKIKNLEEKLQTKFKDTIEIYRKEDTDTGSRIMNELANLSKECQLLLEDVVEDDNLNHREGIIYALLLRYLKRVSAHLKNVASSIVNPFHRLGYRPKTEDKS